VVSDESLEILSLLARDTVERVALIQGYQYGVGLAAVTRGSKGLARTAGTKVNP